MTVTNKNKEYNTGTQYTTIGTAQQTEPTSSRFLKHSVIKRGGLTLRIPDRQSCRAGSNKERIGTL